MVLADTEVCWEEVGRCGCVGVTQTDTGGGSVSNCALVKQAARCERPARVTRLMRRKPDKSPAAVKAEHTNKRKWCHRQKP